MAGRLLMWGFIIALLFYGIWQGYRALSPLSRQRGQGQDSNFSQAVVSEEDETDESGFDYAPIPVSDESGLNMAGQIAVERIEPEMDMFQTELEIQRLRREKSDLHAMLETRQETITQLKHELTVLREQRDKALVGQEMAPQYNEALLFARRGLTADVIAERCDISVAEAALVKAMMAQGAGDERE